MLLEAGGVRVDDFAREAALALSAVGHDFRLVVEPGRYVVADAGVGPGSVVASKDRGDVTRQIVDLATDTLMPVPEIEYYPVPVEASAGARLALLNHGAYTTTFAHLWGPRSQVIPSIEGPQDIEVLCDSRTAVSVPYNGYGYRVDLSR